MAGLFIRLAADYEDDEKILAAGPLAELLFIRGLVYSKRRNSDGFIPCAALSRIGQGIPGDLAVHASCLCDVGLWIADEKGWSLPAGKWAKWQVTKAETEALSATRSQAGRKGSARRWQTDGKPMANASQVDGKTIAESESEKEPSVTEVATTHTRSANGARPGAVRVRDADFVRFWALYPRKVGKDRARAKFEAAVKRSGDTDAIVGGLERAVKLWDAARVEDRFIPHPATWLEQGRWQDELAAGAEPQGRPPCSECGLLDRWSCITPDVCPEEATDG